MEVPPAAAATTGRGSGRPSTFLGTAACEAPGECPSWPKSLRPHVYTAPSAPTNTVCAPPAHAATASTGSWTIWNLALDKPSASSPDPEGPWPSRPWSPFPADTAHVAYVRAGEGPVRAPASANARRAAPAPARAARIGLVGNAVTGAPSCDVDESRVES